MTHYRNQMGFQWPLQLPCWKHIFAGPCMLINTCINTIFCNIGFYATNNNKVNYSPIRLDANSTHFLQKWFYGVYDAFCTHYSLLRDSKDHAALCFTSGGQQEMKNPDCQRSTIIYQSSCCYMLPLIFWIKIVQYLYHGRKVHYSITWLLKYS